MLASGFILLATALSTSASKSLSIKTSAPVALTNVENLEITTTVTNTGDETLKLLKDPRGALSSWATQTFTVANEHGASPEFNGVAVRYVPEAIAKSTEADHFVVLTPGASISVEHEVGRYYNFSSTAAGKYKFTPVNTFSVVDADGSISKIAATTEGASTHLSGNLVTSVGLSPKSIGGGADARFAPVNHLQRRISYSGCSSTQQSQTSAAVSAGQALSTRAYSHLNSNPSGSTLQTTWFGTFSSTRASALKTAFLRLETYPSGWAYNCAECASETSTYAYVYPSQYGTVYLCGYFWRAPATGSGSRADTIPHEGSHFTQVKGTQDYAYGESACKSLAKSSPANAANNADNLAFFSDYA